MKYAGFRDRRWLTTWTLIALIGLGVVVWQAAIGQDRAPTKDDHAVAQAKSLSRAFRAAAGNVMPTVVKIRTITKPMQLKGVAPQENPFKGTPFENFFDEDRMPGRVPFGHPPVPRQGLGSGVIIDSQGIILTNNHVVADADEVLVELPDGRQFQGTDIKTDPQTDLAVVRIKADGDLPAATMGDSDKLEIGDWVLAVGNPFELETSVSAGIISGKGRALRAGKRTNFLQTDAAINPGNSGGALVNLDGEVIGINTAIASNTGGYQGVGFAIPINVAKWVTAQLIESGSVQRAYLGVQIGEIDSQLAGKLGVQPHQGVLVSAVFPRTPAAEAGFEVGDVILAFAGREVHNPRQLQEVVERSAIGSKQKVDVTRNGRAKVLQVVVKPLPTEFGVASTRPGSSGGDGVESNELGLEVGDLTDELAKKLGYEGFTGVLITRADPKGIAAKAGIREGMLILRVGRKDVKSVAEFKAAMKGESLDEGILLLVRAEDRNQFMVLQGP